MGIPHLNNKNDMISLRVSPDVRMRLCEVAEATGVNVSAAVKAGLSKILDEVYDADGNLCNIGDLATKRKIPVSHGYYRISDISKANGISERSIRNMVEKGKASYIKRDGKIYVLLKDVEGVNGRKDKHDKKR